MNLYREKKISNSEDISFQSKMAAKWAFLNHSAMGPQFWDMLSLYCLSGRFECRVHLLISGQSLPNHWLFTHHHDQDGPINFFLWEFEPWPRNFPSSLALKQRQRQQQRHPLCIYKSRWLSSKIVTLKSMLETYKNSRKMCLCKSSFFNALWPQPDRFVLSYSWAFSHHNTQAWF